MVRKHSYTDINDARAIMRTNYRNMPSGCTHCKYKLSPSFGNSQCTVCSLKLMSQK